jgi:hypothetical protein
MSSITGVLRVCGKERGSFALETSSADAPPLLSDVLHAAKARAMALLNNELAEGAAAAAEPDVYEENAEAEPADAVEALLSKKRKQVAGSR